MNKAKAARVFAPLLIAALAAWTGTSQAQPSAHYVPGVEGLKGATLPPPGFYLRDYNVGYYADRLNGPQGNKIGPADPRAVIYANVPRLVWITEKQVFGGYLGLDALLPLQYTDLRVNTPGGQFKHSTFGIGDFMFEGSWSRHLARFDLALAYAVWAPTGDSSPGLTTRAGQGFWTQMLTAGATCYFDADKKWAVSVLNRYEFNSEKSDTTITPGQVYTLEYGLSRTFAKTLDVGVAGYYQQQVTEDTGGGATAQRDRVAGIGPEVSDFFPSIMLGVSLRYAYEFMAENRLQGHTLVLTVTKRF